VAGRGVQERLQTYAKLAGGTARTRDDSPSSLGQRAERRAVSGTRKELSRTKRSRGGRLVRLAALAFATGLVIVTVRGERAKAPAREEPAPTTPARTPEVSPVASQADAALLGPPRLAPPLATAHRPAKEAVESEKAFHGERTDPPSHAKALVRLASEPPGDWYVNDQLVAVGRERVLLEVAPDSVATLAVAHPSLFARRSWSVRAAPGDTLDLGLYQLTIGVLRVATEPPQPGEVWIGGRDTGAETPLRREIATGRHLVNVACARWRIARVLILDRTLGTTAEVVPSDPATFPGATVDIKEGHDHKVVFSLFPGE
jgi:hypothetical protein